MVTVRALGVSETINKTAKSNVQTIYMMLIFMERWGLAAGCEDCGLVDSGGTRVKGPKKWPIQTCMDELASV